MSARAPRVTLSTELEDLARGRAGNCTLPVVGIDEVGVGALAGPLLAVAVVLPPEIPWLAGLRGDSKQLTYTQREHYSNLILEFAWAIGMGRVTPAEIDEIGMPRARCRAIVGAYREICRTLNVQLPAVVDDKRLRYARDDLGGAASVFADKADERSFSVACASIVAKVLRDRHMRKLEVLYPGYSFKKNKGYPTPEHLAALSRLGPSPVHRRSFKPVQKA